MAAFAPAPNDDFAPTTRSVAMAASGGRGDDPRMREAFLIPTIQRVTPIDPIALGREPFTYDTATEAEQLCREELSSDLSELGLAIEYGTKPADSLVFVRTQTPSNRPTAVWVPLKADCGKRCNLLDLMAYWAKLSPASQAANLIHKRVGSTSFADFIYRLGTNTLQVKYAHFAFANGWLDADKWEFHPWHHYDRYDSWCASKVYPINFDPHWLTNAPTCPEFDSLIATQEIGSDPTFLLKALLGRLAYPLGAYDNWQAMPLVYGTSGAGKTTVVVAALTALFDPHLISSLNGAVNQSFPLETIAEARVAFLNDIGQDFVKTFSDSTLKNLIEGGTVLINRKNRPQYIREWDAPVIATCNAPLVWGGGNTGMDRRLIYYEFNKRPTAVDCSLGCKLADPKNQVFIMMDIIRMYRRLASQHGNTPIDTIKATLYPYTVALQQDLTADRTMAQRFIAACITKGNPGSYVSLRRLADGLLEFSEATKSPRMQPSDLREALRDLGIEFVGRKSIARHPLAGQRNTTHGFITPAVFVPYSSAYDEDAIPAPQAPPPRPARQSGAPSAPSQPQVMDFFAPATPTTGLGVMASTYIP